MDQDSMVQAICSARADARWVDASIHMEKWIAACRRQGNSALAEGGSASASGGMMSRLAPRNRAARTGAIDDDSMDDTTMQALRALVPKLCKAVEKEGNAGEQVTFVTFVNKHNAAGKVQMRLLLVSDQAVYNMSVDAKRCKRRIPLSHIGLLTDNKTAD